MTLTMLSLLTFQILFGALDNVLHHEITERLPSRPSARRELALHSAREAIYGVLFLLFAWVEPTGMAALGVLALLVAEVIITLADFLEEDRSRSLPPFERILHTVLAISYGGFLLLVVPWLVGLAAAPTGWTLVSHGVFSWFFTLAAIGVFGFAVRNALAVHALGQHSPAADGREPSGRTALVTGATGFIGSLVVARLRARGDRVIALSRDPRQARVLLGDGVHHVATLAELPRETRIDAVVNLAGAPIIGLPWTAARRRTLLESRIAFTRRLVDWIATLETKPGVLVSGSAIGFYGHRADETLDETARAGDGFAADLCRAWEAEADKARAHGLRVVCLRIGLVLDRNGGALPMMALPARLGLGAILGDGRQWMSWITRSDLVRMIITAIDTPAWEGAVNAVAPQPLRHRDFQRSMARSLRRPLFLAAPVFALRWGLGEMASIFLHSQRVVPARAQALGFRFDLHEAPDALDLLIRPEPAGQAGSSRPLHSPSPMDKSAPTQDPLPGAFHDTDSYRRAAVALRPQGAGRPRREEAGLQA